MQGVGDPSCVEQPQIAETVARISTQTEKTIHDTMMP
jgi:hypothetical protein